MSMANSDWCIAVPTETSIEGGDRSEISGLLIPSPRLFLDRYWVTPFGEIYHVKTGEKKYTWLNAGRDAFYEKVQFSINSKKKNYYVHRLVAELFLPGWDPDHIVNHIDGDTLNNAVWNLEMGNQSYNIYEAYWKKEVYLKVGGRRTNVLARVGTAHAVADNELKEF